MAWFGKVEPIEQMHWMKACFIVNPESMEMSVLARHIWNTVRKLLPWHKMFPSFSVVGLWFGIYICLFLHVFAIYFLAYLSFFSPAPRSEQQWNISGEHGLRSKDTWLHPVPRICLDQPSKVQRRTGISFVIFLLYLLCVIWMVLIYAVKSEKQTRLHIEYNQALSSVAFSCH